MADPLVQIPVQMRSGRFLRYRPQLPHHLKRIIKTRQMLLSISDLAAGLGYVEPELNELHIVHRAAQITTPACSLWRSHVHFADKALKGFLGCIPRRTVFQIRSSPSADNAFHSGTPIQNLFWSKHQCSWT